MYWACSGDNSVRFAPKAGRWRRATFSSRSLDNRKTSFLYFLEASASFQFLSKSNCAKVWFVKEHDITNDGWPVAHPEFSNLPAAKTMMPLPFGKTYRST